LYSYTRSRCQGQRRVAFGQEYADIVAFILAQNGIPAGSIKLAADAPMNRVLVLSDAAAVAGTQSAPAEQVQLGELTGPVKQPSSLGPTQSELDRADDSTSDWLMYQQGMKSTLTRGSTSSTRAR